MKKIILMFFLFCTQLCTCTQLGAMEMEPVEFTNLFPNGRQQIPTSSPYVRCYLEPIYELNTKEFQAYKVVIENDLNIAIRIPHINFLKNMANLDADTINATEAHYERNRLINLKILCVAAPLITFYLARYAILVGSAFFDVELKETFNKWLGISIPIVMALLVIVDFIHRRFHNRYKKHKTEKQHRDEKHKLLKSLTLWLKRDLIIQPHTKFESAIFIPFENIENVFFPKLATDSIILEWQPAEVHVDMQELENRKEESVKKKEPSDTGKDSDDDLESIVSQVVEEVQGMNVAGISTPLSRRSSVSSHNSSHNDNSGEFPTGTGTGIF